MFHLKVVLNEETKELIYDRKLEKGNGPAIYGLEVCRAMDMDRDFLLLAEEIRKNLLNISQNILENKKSHYNSDIFIHNCYVCDKRAEDVHHIKFQCTADSNNIIDTSIVKDVKSNLVPLCKTCHNSVHNGNLRINGYIQTSDGIKLDYHFLDKKVLEENKRKKRKLNEEQIDIILELYKQNNRLSQKNACLYLEKNHNIKISVATYSKIIKHEY